MSVVLDTSFVVDVVRGDVPAVTLMEELEAGSESVLIPTIVLFEVWEGIERSRAPLRETEILEEALAAHRVVPFGLAHAKRAGKLSGELARRGVVLGDADLVVAGTALHEDAEVITRNARDFGRVPDLRVRAY